MNTSGQLSLFDEEPGMLDNSYYYNKFCTVMLNGLLAYIKNHPGDCAVIMMAGQFMKSLYEIRNGLKASDEFRFGMELYNHTTDSCTKFVEVVVYNFYVSVACKDWLNNRFTTLWSYEANANGSENIEEPIEKINEFKFITKLLNDKRTYIGITEPYDIESLCEMDDGDFTKDDSITQETINRIRKFSEDRDWDQFHSPANLAKSIVIEAAELLECFQWDEEKFDIQHLKEELADVIIYSQNLLDKLELDADEIVNMKLNQNEEKYPVEKAKGRSDKYDKLRQCETDEDDIIIDEEGACSP